MRAREVIKRIRRLGGVQVRTRGAHIYYEAIGNGSGGTPITCLTSVSQHPGDIPTGTLHKIEKDLEPVFGKGWLT
ncbi:MAG: type II toxin-antitoxin system HicA family toxin, partial [Longispora sp.]|nr:type II toxin-antitoxin system HicA family toxin [Longispora sp. (in: high G+C Gram-positive bacteria)]